jgi:magnesium-transporting ATPase (P-type)
MGIMSSNQIKVIRNGIQMNVQSECLVVGDLIEIEQGMRIPADCILISSDPFESSDELKKVTRTKVLEVD